MAEYIKRKDAIDICTKCVDFQDSIENINASAEAMRIRRLIKEMPSADVVEREVLDQVYWERDTALHQLAEIGKGLGEKMDDVVERKHGKWTLFENDIEQNAYECSACNDVFVLLEGTPQENLYNFCPNCGADMRGEEDG